MQFCVTSRVTAHRELGLMTERSPLNWAQPRWGCSSLADQTQGSSCLATLGFETKSLWDLRKCPNFTSRTKVQQIGNLRSDAQRGSPLNTSKVRLKFRAPLGNFSKNWRWYLPCLKGFLFTGAKFRVPNEWGLPVPVEQKIQLESAYL